MNDNVYCCVSHVSSVLRNSWETHSATFYFQGHFIQRESKRKSWIFTFPPSALYSFSLTSSRRARPKSVILMWLGDLTRTFRAARSLWTSLRSSKYIIPCNTHTCTSTHTQKAILNEEGTLMYTNLPVTSPSVFTSITSTTPPVHFFNDLCNHHYHTVVIVMAVIPISLQLFSRKALFIAKGLPVY